MNNQLVVAGPVVTHQIGMTELDVLISQLRILPMELRFVLWRCLDDLECGIAFYEQIDRHRKEGTKVPWQAQRIAGLIKKISDMRLSQFGFRRLMREIAFDKASEEQVLQQLTLGMVLSKLGRFLND